MSSINHNAQTGYKMPHESKPDEKDGDARMRDSSAEEAKPGFDISSGKHTMPDKAG